MRALWSAMTIRLLALVALGVVIGHLGTMLYIARRWPWGM
jgi:hypothetical protein